MLIPSIRNVSPTPAASLSRRVNANSQQHAGITGNPKPSLSRRVNANSQHTINKDIDKLKLIKKGEC